MVKIMKSFTNPGYHFTDYMYMMLNNGTLTRNQSVQFGLPDWFQTTVAYLEIPAIELLAAMTIGQNIENIRVPFLLNVQRTNLAVARINTLDKNSIQVIEQVIKVLELQQMVTRLNDMARHDALNAVVDSSINSTHLTTAAMVENIDLKERHYSLSAVYALKDHYKSIKRSMKLIDAKPKSLFLELLENTK
jgi:hypothetical protein